MRRFAPWPSGMPSWRLAVSERLDIVAEKVRLAQLGNDPDFAALLHEARRALRDDDLASVGTLLDIAEEALRVRH